MIRALPAPLVGLMVVVVTAAAACGGGPDATASLTAPEVPQLVLAERHGGPAVPGHVCIEVDVGTVLDAPVAEIRAALERLGVEVATSACDATLRISGTAKRLSARYAGGATCFTGWEVDASLAWQVGGVESGAWPVKGRFPPPEWTEVCPDADATVPLPDARWGLGPILVQLFGGAGFASPFMDGSAVIGPRPNWFSERAERGQAFDSLLEPPDPTVLSGTQLAEAVAWIAGALWRADDSDQREWLAYRVLWLSGEPCCGRASGALDPLVPYLIRALVAEEPSDALASGHLHTVLARLTGRSFDSGAEWWDWWQARR